MTSLRDRLRADTAFRHDCVDRAYSALDLTQPDDLRTFLRTQLTVLCDMSCRPSRHSAAATALASRMADALRADLRALGGTPVGSGGARPLHGTAVLYMLLGSSLGTQVLRRRWLGASNPAVAAADRYFGLAAPQGAWRALCEELAGRSPHGPEADRIVQDADALFELHLAALAGPALRPEGVLHV
ncbi:hypothetical protein [Rubellimicrobium rubrum]|uniref:hypothetical protein n=1 Tax=Rubellimicrobium rubrum TaxID=2585369 RepID=UPI00159BD025|nr:hypothetical protein [Rubellimicrobium rubrum]